MRSAVLGIGEWVPERIRTNSEWPKNFAAIAAASGDREIADVTVADRADPYQAIVARHLAAEDHDPFLGSKRRRIPEETTSDVEAETIAARAALADARIDPREVDVVLSFAVISDRPAQPTAPKVAQLVGATKAIGIGLDAACASMIGQLLFAASLIETGRARIVLLTCSQLMTRVFPLEHPASPTVGDGATAMVVGPSERAGILSVSGISQGEYYDAVAWRRIRADSRWFRNGGPFYLGSYDSALLQQIVTHTVRFGAETIADAAQRSGVALSDIAILASVQPRRWIPAAIAEALGLSADVAPQTFDERAHLGPCGVVTNLIEARRRGLLSCGPDREPPVVCMYAQGAGFTRAAILLRWVALP
jgi:3-oxoacyl-[acyl-carrier-protein] synthase-3